MFKYDIILLTEEKLENPEQSDPIIDNVILEDKILRDALESRGFRVGRFAWSRKDIDWSQSKYLLFRTTWDYHNKWKQFIDWLNKTKQESTFINPIETIVWNFDKRYLLELENRGVNIAKTKVFEKGVEGKLKDAFSHFKIEELVLKPLISAGGRHTYRIKKENCEALEEVFRDLLKEEAMMLQEFQNDVPVNGEISLMFFGGKYTHSILKLAKSGDFRVQDDFGGSVHDHEASEEEVKFAKYALSQIQPIPVYARVDVFRDNYGNLALAEIELIEPELWFRNYPEAAEVFADYLKDYCK